MKQHRFTNKSYRQKYQKTHYRTYLLTLLIVFSIFPVSKILLDLHIFLATGRVVGTEDWVDIILTQKEGMALNVPPPEKRILIVSGSNGLFGISAATISQETGIKTINLSSHASLGGDYILSRAQKLIRSGDVILLPLEYPFYYSSGISDDFGKSALLGRFIVSYDRDYLSKVSPGSFFNLGLNNIFSARSRNEYFSYFRGHLSQADILTRLNHQKTSFGCYSGLTLNDYGDETCNMGKENLPVDPVVIQTAMFPGMTNPDPGGYIARFVQFAKGRGAKIIPLHPVSTYTDDYEKLPFKASAETIKKFWEQQGVEFQDSLMDALLPPNLMYNSNYHPRDAGRQKRTRSIINLLRKQPGIIKGN
jgi:hypothetical protein